MKTRICHISTVNSRYDTRIFEKECCSLAKAGFEVFFVVADGMDNEEHSGVNIVSACEKYSSRLDRMRKATRKAYEKVLEINPQVCHIHDPELLTIAIKLQKKGFKVIFDSHEFTAIQLREARAYIPKCLRSMVSFLYRKYELYVTKRISGVIIPCLRRGEDYFSGKYKDMELINNVPIISRIVTPQEQIEKKSNATCYVGSITKERGIVNTIKASYQAGCELYLIGLMADELRAELETMPEYQCVRYLGKLRMEEFSRIVSQCNVGLCLLQKLGQHDEGDNLSTKIYEYMAMGIPVVVSDMRMNKQIVEEKQCGICVNPDNVDEIAEAIRSIIEDSEKADTMAQNGARLARECFCWEEEEKKLLRFYKKVIYG